MNPFRCTGRPLVAVLVASVVTLFATTNIALGQARTVPLTNAELEGVFEFVPETVENGVVTRTGTTGRRLEVPNLAAARILNRLDIDGDGLADNSRDTDGDGLPDNWEAGGFESLTVGGFTVDRVVFFPAPTPIVPGTPPTPIFTRLAVATSALDPDTDGDGLTDFVEVFGLMFIDEFRSDGDDIIRNGLLEDGVEWEDKNGDGLPSPGEFPLDNSSRSELPLSGLLHDFDGFVFTDPTNADTDGDSIPDGIDDDPLINPRAFGNDTLSIERINDEDLDEDGLGNGMDMGNDLVADDPGVPEDFQGIDNPDNLSDLLNFFRRDLLAEDIVPESAIEDLLGADWDGNGLWRTTDVRTWFIVIDPADPGNLPAEADFVIDGQPLFATQTFDEISEIFNDDDFDRYGSRGIGMGWQDLLEPSGPTQFIPDRRVWSILYSWRMPGFDIDGDGFIGVPNISATARRIDDGVEVATVSLAREPGGFMASDAVPIMQADDLDARPFDDRIRIVVAPDSTGGGGGGDNSLDGQIDAPEGFPAIPLGGCGPVGMISLLGIVAGLSLVRRRI